MDTRAFRSSTERSSRSATWTMAATPLRSTKRMAHLLGKRESAKPVATAVILGPEVRPRWMAVRCLP